MDFQPMSPEEIERTMQFLLNQPAQFAAEFATLSGKTGQIQDALVGLTGIVGQLTGHLGQVTDRLDRLTAAQDQTDQQLKDLQRS